MPAVIIRQRKTFRRKDGQFIYFEDNAGEQSGQKYLFEKLNLCIIVNDNQYEIINNNQCFVLRSDCQQQGGDEGFRNYR